MGQVKIVNQTRGKPIYQCLYVQGRGELRRELARCLRSGRGKRQSQGQCKRSGPVANMVMISDRPAEVEDRAVPGHWEGDLIIGKGGARSGWNTGGAFNAICSPLASPK